MGCRGCECPSAELQSAERSVQRAECECRVQLQKHAKIVLRRQSECESRVRE